MSASVGTPPSVSTSTGASNVTAASTVSPSVYAPSAPASDVTSTPVTATGTGASRQSTLCAGSCGSPACPSARAAPVAADLIVPPFVSSVSASTAMPVGAVFGSATR